MSVITAIIIGFLAREWTRLIVTAFNWIKNRLRLKSFLEASKRDLESLQRSGIIEDYEITGFDLTGPAPVLNVRSGSRRSLRDFKVVRPEDS